MNELYKQQVGLLIRIIPLIYPIKEFAVHGGTAINLFVRDLSRYSVDLDITYLPLKEREESMADINRILLELKTSIEKAIPGIRVVPKPAVWKLLCTKDGATVKIEVNGTKRGIIGEVEDRELCPKARAEFNMSCRAKIVPFSQLYGGKISAALSRQHPRDLFDCKYMELESFSDVKNGVIFCLLGSEKPIIESLQPNPIDQSEALKSQFKGMTDTTFDYEDFEQARVDLIKQVNESMTTEDKEFLLSFERGEPDWSKCCAGNLSLFPSVRWKLQNILNLKKSNPQKFNVGIEKLSKHLTL